MTQTTELRNGFIDYFNEIRAFGFCRVEGDPGRYFFHVINVVSGTPRSGLTATFEVGKSSRGPVAVNVRVRGAQ